MLPRSHRVMLCCAFDAFGKEHDAAAAAFARERGAVQEPQEVYIRRGEAVLFHGSLLHAGSDWTSSTAAAPNLRLHVAYHHTAVPRELHERDTTMPLVQVLARTGRRRHDSTLAKLYGHLACAGAS